MACVVKWILLKKKKKKLESHEIRLLVVYLSCHLLVVKVWKIPDFINFC